MPSVIGVPVTVMVPPLLVVYVVVWDVAEGAALDDVNVPEVRAGNPVLALSV